jgi:phosphoesterase RecJ-like protein
MHPATWKRIQKLLRSKKSFLLTAHVNPEGDSVGSLLALSSLLRKLGKKCYIASENGFPKRLRFLPCRNWYSISRLKSRKAMPSFDACIVVDCASLERTGKVATLLNPGIPIVNIDHHVSNRRFGDINLVDVNAAACGEIIHEMFTRFHVPLSKGDAENLYVSISTDTGSFRYSNTRERTHRIAAELIHKGLDVEGLNHQIYSNYTISRLHLLVQFLKSVQMALEGKLAWGVITKGMVRATRTEPDEAEGFVDFLRAIDTVQIAFILIENNNRIKASFRSKGAPDVNWIASRFAGGGHKKASGAEFGGSLAETQRKIVSVVKKYLQARS